MFSTPYSRELLLALASPTLTLMQHSIYKYFPPLTALRAEPHMTEVTFETLPQEHVVSHFQGIAYTWCVGMYRYMSVCICVRMFDSLGRGPLYDMSRLVPLILEDNRSMT
jgi:hypothetical protein